VHLLHLVRVDRRCAECGTLWEVRGSWQGTRSVFGGCRLLKEGWRSSISWGLSRNRGEWLWVPVRHVRLGHRHVKRLVSVGRIRLELTGVSLREGKRGSASGTAIDRGERLLLIRSGSGSGLRRLRLYRCQFQGHASLDGITYESSGRRRLSSTGGGYITAATSSKRLSTLGPVFSQSLLKIRSSLKLGFLGRLSISGNASRNCVATRCW
jgi:hypothetical protein